MKIFFAFTVLVVSLVSASPVSRIVNGEEAQVGQFPYQVLLYPETPQGKVLCGGICKYWMIFLLFVKVFKKYYIFHTKQY